MKILKNDCMSIAGGECYFLFTGADVVKPGAAAGTFKYPTYVQDIMGLVLQHTFKILWG